MLCLAVNFLNMIFRKTELLVIIVTIITVVFYNNYTTTADLKKA